MYHLHVLINSNWSIIIKELPWCWLCLLLVSALLLESCLLCQSMFLHYVCENRKVVLYQASLMTKNSLILPILSLTLCKLAPDPSRGNYILYLRLFWLVGCCATFMLVSMTNHIWSSVMLRNKSTKKRMIERNSLLYCQALVSWKKSKKKILRTR